MAGTAERKPVSGWAVGFVLFAGIMMIMAGVFHAIAGFAAILEDEFYVVNRNYAYEVDATAWGWIHLILGIVVAAAGCAVISGRLWARIIGIALAVASGIANFFFIPYYPFWSLLLIALDVFVIWALCVYGREDARRVPQ
ncbi:hypothetical protein [Spirillospora sp. NPDC047279]|uniref:DUF7144 family membrane protein n=1 Tax=Spirillospora sp. NPDC047279 TaxID=3155478 RepID=UPI0033EAC611